MSVRKLPTVEEIHAKTLDVFGKRPCYLQVQVCLEILRREKHIVCCAATGFGKSLAYMMPLLFDAQLILVVVTPLNILGKQNIETLAKVDVCAVAVSALNNDKETFKVWAAGSCYRLAVVNPEVLMEKSSSFEDLWKSKQFTDRLPSLVFDEAHCICIWRMFRPQYKEIQRLRWLLPSTVHFCLLSATLSPPVIKDISQILNLNQSNTISMIRPNDRPNVFLSVHTMKQASYHQLDFLVPITDGVGALPSWKFIIFFDGIKDAEAACKHLLARLPEHSKDRERLIWFHSIMSDTYREEEAAALAVGSRTGACGTDSIGMGVDIPDIRVIIQWKLTCNMESIWQRFGRAAHDPNMEGVAIIFVESKHLDAESKPSA
ncbi:P-loop containing nucleoside triphosphate hydrolase protein, partial [Amylostereum chailletii]